MPSLSRKPKRVKGSSTRRTPHSRIIGGGEMAGLIRGFDWSRSALGPIENWSDTLITTVNLLLASRHPMFLWWGPDLIQFYNDGYRPSIRADKHPSAVGQRGVECWPEIWPIIFPQIDAVMARGESTWNTNQLVPINRNGKLEEVYWTYSYSPVRDETGAVRGTLVVCSETTEQVLSERRLRTLLGIAVDSLIETQPPESQSLVPFAQSIVRKLDDDPADIPFAALYLAARGDVSHVASTAAGGRCGDPCHWPLADVLNSGRPLLLEDLGTRFDGLVCRPWPEPITSGYLLPLFLPGSSIQAVLLFGISPRLPFDGGYRTFFEVVGARIAGLLQSEIHQLELAQAARRFRSLAEADPFGMVIGGLEGDLRYVNPAFLRTLGYSEAEVSSGQVRWDSLTPPEYAPADAKAVEQLRTSGHCQVYEKAYLSKDGRRIPILIGASVIDSSGAPEVAAFVTDLTPLKVAEEALRRANDELERKVAERTAALEAEISDRKRAELSLRELTGRLLVTQDEERRHMARELHDSAGQTLAALGMNLSVLQTVAASNDPEVTRLAAESLRLSDDLTREIRTLSYLLHPPLLDEVGLTSALRWFVDGFAERSKIAVELDLPEKVARLPRDIELVVFRVVQESLTNVHRHSGSSSAKIYLRHSDHAVEFEISDRGKGISPEKQRDMTAAKAGVGVRGMHERVRQLGGELQIVSGVEGTKVIVKLPMRLAPAGAHS
jgi:PAS domain S-box-containing protein